MIIGEYDKMMFGVLVYIFLVGYLVDYVIFIVIFFYYYKEKEKDWKKREEMMRWEEKVFFGFVEWVWRWYCDVVRVRDLEGEFGEGGYDVED